MTFCDFLHFYERLLYKMIHFYERLWVSLLAVVGIIPRTGFHLSPGSIAAAIQPAVGICLSAKRLLLLRAVERFRHIPMRGSH